ncbi:hypothetical protein PU634_05240 [Oceanimonas pelagia]|uniref:Uncharacterized protein n=1 Tax=Oceanimonas pelagia TaxID=3028314 RepID=A0AA50KQC4_9GAMM|nr:hypothetical protein [Oceanimonas pelagia]WMC11773.1 hypothetical protein PU634_05240 [Oceanimonas pelagia]
MKTLTGEELEGMVEHWLSTPVNGYLGSDYGQDAKSILQLPHTDEAADELIRKLRQDIIITTSLPAGAVSLYGVPSGVDRFDIVLEVAGRTFDLSGGN